MLEWDLFSHWFSCIFIFKNCTTSFFWFNCAPVLARFCVVHRVLIASSSSTTNQSVCNYYYYYFFLSTLLPLLPTFRLLVFAFCCPSSSVCVCVCVSSSSSSLQLAPRVFIKEKIEEKGHNFYDFLFPFSRLSPFLRLLCCRWWCRRRWQPLFYYLLHKVGRDLLFGFSDIVLCVCVVQQTVTVLQFAVRLYNTD